MLSFFPRDVLDEILNLIESVSEGFLPTFDGYDKNKENKREKKKKKKKKKETSLGV